jgi:hypothetical protein
MDALAGTLEHFMPVQILRLLQNTGSTGRLEVVQNGERAEIFLTDGRPCFARMTGAHARVGDILAGAGDIRPEAIELTAAFQQDSPGTRLGSMLVESGAIDPDRLRAAVLEVQRRIICRVLLWNQGSFQFHPDERVVGEDITLAVDLDRLIIEALRSAGDRNEGEDRSIAA